MGKSLPSVTKLQDFARVTAQNLNGPKFPIPRSKIKFSPEFSKSLEGGYLERKIRKMEGPQRENRIPLSEVVSDCMKRWFQDTLKEARAGDIGMQVLVGQMYFRGYGIPKDVHKGRVWITKASKNRSSVWKVSDKHPGYNASDSDSDELKGDLK
ncbi:uncharacterized protein LOC143851695 [Tasmannia lanceolata]|uniref:uncharacterized protein LOC143851695 n=1 Tax=Tasmannia lanceolata TaxID=3420 RepID=UPI0040633BF7